MLGTGLVKAKMRPQELVFNLCILGDFSDFTERPRERSHHVGGVQIPWITESRGLVGVAALFPSHPVSR